jgi:hypothetical protein
MLHIYGATTSISAGKQGARVEEPHNINISDSCLTSSHWLFIHSDQVVTTEIGFGT